MHTPEPQHRISPAIRADLERFKAEIRRYLDGGFSDRRFQALRVPRGVYEQRQAHRYMVRIRLPAGCVRTAQLRRVAEVAARDGSGVVHLTTRQDLQIHHIAAGALPRIVDDLLEVGLSASGGGGNTVRNVMGCYRAGVCPDEAFDVRPVVVALTEHLLDQPDSFNLPRKLKITASGCATDCALATWNDIGLIAVERDGVQGFQVFAAGGMGGMSQPGICVEPFVSLGDIGAVVMALKRLFQEHGDRANRQRARLRFVLARLGPEAFVALYRASLERERAAGEPRLSLRPFPSPPAGREPASAPAPGPALERWRRFNVLPERIPGRRSVVVHVPLGHITSDRLRAFADVVDGMADAEVRVTPRQDFVLTGVPEADLGTLRGQLAALGGGLAEADDARAVVSCTGADTCRLGICLSGGLAVAIAETLPPLDKRVRVHVNGCPNACGQHPSAAIGLQGRARRVAGELLPAYRVSLGGRVGPGVAREGEPVGDVAARDAPGYLRALLERFEQAPEPDFHAWLDGGGREVARALLERFEIPSRDEAPEHYVDWGADRPFSLAARGEGECGAGTLALIEDDLRVADAGLRKAARAADPAPPLSETVIAAARALLVARSVEASTPAGTFLLFAEHFVASGLVDRSALRLMRKVLEAPEALAGSLEEVEALLNRVRVLYRSLDPATLEFRAEPLAATGSGVERLPPHKAARRVGAGRVRLIDVRDRDEVGAVRLAGAEVCAWNDGELKRAAATMDREAALLLYCASGARSLRAARWLAAQDFKAVATIEGGIEAWREAGFPVRTASR